MNKLKQDENSHFRTQQETKGTATLSHYQLFSMKIFVTYKTFKNVCHVKESILYVNRWSNKRGVRCTCVYHFPMICY